MKTVPFNYEKFKASVDDGKPYVLCTTHGAHVEFLALTGLESNEAIVGILTKTVETWDVNGSFMSDRESLNDLRMIVPYEPKKDILDEFHEWAIKNLSEFFLSENAEVLVKLIEIFRKERNTL